VALFVKNNMWGWETASQAARRDDVHDEPGIYIRGEFGIRLEDELLVTGIRRELLTPQSPSIEDPFGGMD